MNDKAILGRVVAMLEGTCRICGCESDACSLEEGGKCGWFDALRTVCSAPKCVSAASWQRRRDEKAAKRAAERAKREAEMPAWMRVRREEMRKSRRVGKAKRVAKGRAA